MYSLLVYVPSPNVWNLNSWWVSPEISWEIIQGVDAKEQSWSTKLWSPKFTNETSEPDAILNTDAAAFSKNWDAYTPLEPLGFSPNTSDKSFPAVYRMDADIEVLYAESDPLNVILNADDDSCASIEAVIASPLPEVVQWCVDFKTPTNFSPLEPDTLIPTAPFWLYPPICPTRTIVTVPASLK